MKKVLLGNSSITSVIGYLVAGLVVLDDMLKAGETSWLRIAVAVAIAILGRVSADSGKVKGS
ncbi:hypothetical protein [Chitinophaga sp. sic0106]|uniref:hypothetical protein n=1 Tax=Chitinophaga sp. sic0106 TaxID=2854785 RepID=UPI001C483A49|nr:hypothetical protein [Chitinophaga sp. sic0106]MBV7529050.1 hypothetical protein [Chitinophaga sp. sic0106]